MQREALRTGGSEGHGVVVMLVVSLSPRRSHGRRLFDAVEADAGGGRGDGHGSCHAHPQGVVVLPAVPPLPGGRTDLGERHSCG